MCVYSQGRLPVDRGTQHYESERKSIFLDGGELWAKGAISGISTSGRENAGYTRCVFYLYIS